MVYQPGHRDVVAAEEHLRGQLERLVAHLETHFPVADPREPTGDAAAEADSWVLSQYMLYFGNDGTGMSPIDFVYAESRRRFADRDHRAIAHDALMKALVRHRKNRDAGMTLMASVDSVFNIKMLRYRVLDAARPKRNANGFGAHQGPGGWTSAEAELIEDRIADQDLPPVPELLGDARWLIEHHAALDESAELLILDLLDRIHATVPTGEPLPSLRNPGHSDLSRVFASTHPDPAGEWARLVDRLVTRFAKFWQARSLCSGLLNPPHALEGSYASGIRAAWYFQAIAGRNDPVRHQGAAVASGLSSEATDAAISYYVPTVAEVVQKRLSPVEGIRHV